MPTVSEVMGGLLQNAIEHPQSTIQSILTSIYGITTTLMISGALSLKMGSAIATANTVAKVMLGMYQKDTKC